MAGKRWKDNLLLIVGVPFLLVAFIVFAALFAVYTIYILPFVLGGVMIWMLISRLRDEASR